MDKNTAPPTVDFEGLFCESKPSIPPGVAVCTPQFEGLYLVFPDGDEVNLHDEYEEFCKGEDEDAEFFVSGTPAHVWLTTKYMKIFADRNIEWIAETEEQVVMPANDFFGPTS